MKLKTNKVNNPFITGGYVSPEYFCDREKEAEIIVQAISSKRNLTIVSLRRMGKTGLLKHVKYNYEKKGEKDRIVFIDLLPSQSAGDLLSVLGSSLLKIQQNDKSFIQKLLSSLSTLRPGLSYDPLSGQPTLVVHTASPDDFQLGFQQLLELFSSVSRQLTVVLDEFQQIMMYPEKNIEHMLRTLIQDNPNITFIFSGSNKHMMETIFNGPSHPFYQSTEMLYLGEIPNDPYIEFIGTHFENSKMELSKESITELIEWCRGHTFYVQYFCNRLWALKKNRITIETLSQIKLEILESFEPLFVGMGKLLTKSQVKLLTGIAAEKGVRHALSSDFISEYGLKSPSSVTTSLKALDKKDLIIKINDFWLVQNPFYSRWLKYNYDKLN